MLLYFTPALLTFTVASQALLADEESKFQVSSWMFLVAIAVLWPVTLPCIVRKKLSQRFAKVEEQVEYMWIRVSDSSDQAFLSSVDECLECSQ
ncbi:hypothetical protein [Almyronema epifaneia]|uniref:Uncharacterized protein n=1 Tax=Almyronema epifaneia S1 TaxID=2991925 RepID=A0ABW6IHA0_9CYAN